MSKWFKLFKFPRPTDLGAKNDNFLPSEFLGIRNSQGYTWEQYYRDLKRMFPIRYFIAKSLPEFIEYKIWFKIKRPLSDFYWYLKYNLLTSHRYHKLDLRQPPGECDEYKYGWRDVPEKMLYANFNLLKEYLEKEDPYDLSSSYSLEEIYNDPGLKHQFLALEEAKFLLHWWKVIRKQKYKEKSDVLNEAYKYKNQTSPSYDELMNKFGKLDLEFEKEEDEMLLRLMKIRKTLWT